MFRHLRWRIAVPYVILILIVAGALTAYVSNAVRSNHLADLESRLLDSARLLGDALASPLARGESADFFDAPARHYAGLLSARVTIIALDGTVLADSQEDRTRMDNHLDRPEVQRALAAGQGTAIRYSQTAGYDMMYAAAAVRAGGETVGVARVALSLSAIETQIARLREGVLFAGLVAALVAIALALFIAERMAGPVRELTQVAGRLAQGDLSVHLLPATRDEIGALTAAFGEMADQLREKITALTEERSRLAAVLRHMADGVLITDANGIVRLINPAAGRLLNTTEEQAIGRSFAQVARVYPLIDLWRRCRERGEAHSELIEMERNGPALQAIITPFQEAGRPGLLVILQDLTLVRRLETTRRDFVSNISHELRTPLAALKALTETLRDSALEDPPAARHFLDRMDAELDALTQMVQELLELSRIESRQAPLQLAPTPVSEIIMPAVERLRPQAERAGLSITVDAPADLPLVLADAQRIGQVMTNLLHNAIKFTPPGGRLAVSAGQQQEAGKSFVVIAVSDTGVGIAATDLPRIFERFYKADRARSGSGTGLGLAIAKHLVQAHGGAIWAESVEGRGSTFRFTLPAVNATLTTPA